MLDELRNSGLLRPAKEHPHSETWHESPKDLSWKSGKNSAYQLKQDKKVSPKVPPTVKRKASPVKDYGVCKLCKDNANKSGYCETHHKLIRADKKRAYREKRKTQPRVCKVCGKEAVKYSGHLLCSKHLSQHRKTKARVCKICGSPACETSTKLLCRKHLNEYQKELAHKRDSKTDTINESAMARKKAALETLWQSKLEKYGKE